MKTVLAASFATVVALGACARTQPATATIGSATPATARSPLVGSWRLAWLDLPGPDGALRRITDAKGSLIYTPSGQVSVQVMYALTTATPSSGPVQYAQGGYEGSFGQYLVDEETRTVTHRYDGANVRELVGKDLPRRYELVDGRLILRSTRADEHWSVVWTRY
jgi:hypothetical protein